LRRSAIEFGQPDTDRHQQQTKRERQHVVGHALAIVVGRAVRGIFLQPFDRLRRAARARLFGTDWSAPDWSAPDWLVPDWSARGFFARRNGKHPAFFRPRDEARSYITLGFRAILSQACWAPARIFSTVTRMGAMPCHIGSPHRPVIAQHHQGEQLIVNLFGALVAQGQ